jgi:hypothetical protein
VLVPLQLEETEAGGLDLPPPPWPGREQDLVAPVAEPDRQRHRREEVPGLGSGDDGEAAHSPILTSDTDRDSHSA